MTMKPKARKFRIRRNTPGATGDHARAPEGDVTPPVETESTSADFTYDTTNADDISTPAEASMPQDIDAIRQEGLTGRQLRMARRLAQKNGLAPTSDFDAVRLLRAKGIDPFQRTNILSLVDGRQGNDVSARENAQPPAQLPQTIPAKPSTLPGPEQSPADRRAQEITRIQRDIGRRRRRKFLLLLSRLAAFIFLPTLIFGYYFYAIATPMYSTKSEFLILTADGSAGGAAAGLFSGTSFATGQDSIATQSYLQSKDAMLRLDRDVGFRTHFSQDWIDPIQRLDTDASNEAAYKLYKKFIKLGYDPTEGVIRMELSTADPAVSASYSHKLIEYAEERVDQLSKEKRQDAVKTASESLDEAKAERREAQHSLVKLQEGTLLDPEGQIASIRSLMNSVELQLQEKQLALSTQLNNTRPNKAKVEALESQIAVLLAELKKQGNRLTQATEGDSSLASKASEIQIAQADLATADLVLQAALETKRQSEVEANKQVRYLTVSVKPVASQDPSYPRAFENTVLAFMIFGGIYLLISLTASILREQVSS